ncbi:hypothetical protein AG1IA_09924 [Rhizoctonia solani AG-1 IA]|uniref:Uncharacterized protein n=1 Tax=Thanatephorus cucumeris (strain AG1-IA) TaxID=983506 RepID=L8WCY6_THACA|nr:hypothetical protein AG1IA_09924 [Rhizoctonia solani AG-1 IA]
MSWIILKFADCQVLVLILREIGNRPPRGIKLLVVEHPGFIPSDVRNRTTEEGRATMPNIRDTGIIARFSSRVSSKERPSSWLGIRYVWYETKSSYKAIEKESTARVAPPYLTPATTFDHPNLLYNFVMLGGLASYGSDSEGEEETKQTTPPPKTGDSKSSNGSLGSSLALPPPKKRRDGPVRITVEAPKFDDADDNDSERAQKKPRTLGPGTKGAGSSSLFSALPAPKNVVGLH